jgi:subtilisin family serine protease
MDRIRIAAVLLLLAPAVALGSDVVSTYCRETEVPLDARHSVALLGGCGEEYSANLLWNLDRIDQVTPALDGHFNRSNRGDGSVVYVMDTGVMASHREFGDRVIGGFDASSVAIGSSSCRSPNKATEPCFLDLEELPTSSHGTAVASIVAGENVGVAPGASIVSIRVMNERGLATTRTYLDGLNAIVRHAWSPSSPQFDTAVVNISGWVLERLSAVSSEPGPLVRYAEVEQKIREMVRGVDRYGRPDARGKRFLFVVAANNIDGGCGAAGYVDRFPATLGKRIDGLITVGGMTADNRWWHGSCRGGIEVLAPAQGIFSATISADDHYRGQKPNIRSGTSFAAPVIAGIAARMLADRPNLTPQQLESWITSTPSRIEERAQPFADGKVGYVRSVAPRVTRAAATVAVADEPIR